MEIVASSPSFTFWMDRAERGTKAQRLTAENRRQLVDGRQVGAPPGLTVEMLRLKLVESEDRAYTLTAKLVLTPGASTPTGPCELRLAYPGVQRVKYALAALAPRDEVGVVTALEVFPSRAAVVEARGAGIALTIAILVPVFAFGLWLFGFMVPFGLDNRLAMTVVCLMLCVVVVLGQHLVGKVGQLMYYAASETLVTVITAVAVNAWMGACMWAATGGLGSMRLPYHRVAAYATLAINAAAPYVLPGELGHVFHDTGSHLVALACLVPGLYLGSSFAAEKNLEPEPNQKQP